MSSKGTSNLAIGIVGDGHLARLVALAARSAGRSTVALSPVRLEGLLAGKEPQGASRILDGVDGVIVATERCAAEALHLLERRVKVVPPSVIVAIAQDRQRERAWFDQHGIPSLAWRAVNSPDQLQEALQDLGGEGFLKPARRGEEAGRPTYVRRREQALSVWAASGSVPSVLEEAASIQLALGVVVARSATGQLVIYPPALHQRQGTELRWSVMPAPLSSDLTSRAEGLARRVAELLPLVGVATIELFELAGGQLVVNEIALGPHPAHLADEYAYSSGQCAQLLRVFFEERLEAIVPLRPTASAPIMGDLWTEGRSPSFDAVRGMPGVRVAFYGDRSPDPGRVHGHLAASASTPEEAVSLLLAAQRLAAAARAETATRTGSAVPAT